MDSVKYTTHERFFFKYGIIVAYVTKITTSTGCQCYNCDGCPDRVSETKGYISNRTGNGIYKTKEQALLNATASAKQKLGKEFFEYLDSKGIDTLEKLQELI